MKTNLNPPLESHHGWTAGLGSTADHLGAERFGDSESKGNRREGYRACDGAEMGEPDRNQGASSPFFSLKCFCTSLAFCVPALVFGSQAAIQNLPILIDHYDAGLVQTGQVFQHEFVIANTNSSPMTVRSVRSLCDCLEVLSWPTNINAGSEGRISALAVPERMGPLDSSLQVELAGDATPLEKKSPSLANDIASAAGHFQVTPRVLLTGVDPDGYAAIPSRFSGIQVFLLAGGLLAYDRFLTQEFAAKNRHVMTVASTTGLRSITSPRATDGGGSCCGGKK